MMTTAKVNGDESAPRGDDRQVRWLGYGVIIGVFGVLGLWSSLAPIDSAVVAPGVIKVQNYRKTVQHLEGGIIRALLVREGQEVAEGDALLELEGTQFRAELDVLRAQQLTLKAQEARLLAERDELPDVEYPQIEGFATTDARVEEARAGQQALFNARRKVYDGEVSVLRENIVQSRAQIRGLESLLGSKRALIASYGAEIKDLRGLLVDGFADRQRLREVERTTAVLEGELAELQASISESRAKISESELRILQVDREFQTKVATELGDVQAKLSDLDERLRSAADRVARATVRAPVGGRVLKLSVHTIGGVVSPGQALMDVVPDREALMIEARIAPMDVERVQAGVRALVRFSGFRRDRVPTVDGHLVDVSADSLVDEATGVAFYLARVELDSVDGANLGNVELKPGMPAEVMINTGSRTLLGYLLEPLSNSIARSFRED
jgi:epimerase transport system membrane fusion protein